MSLNDIKKIIQKYNNGSFLIHSDLNRGFKFDIFDRDIIIKKHIDNLDCRFSYAMHEWLDHSLWSFYRCFK